MSASLGGCGGGGGGGGGDAAPPSPAPAPAPGGLGGTHFHVAGVVGSDASGHSVVVADANANATTTAAMLSVPVPSSLPMVASAAYTIDAGSPSVTYRGSPLTFFVKGGELWQIDLSPTRTPNSVRISSLNDACQPQMVAPLDATGLDAWVLVTTAGADGDCSTGADNRQAFVRSGVLTATAPTLVPASTHVEPVYLTGADGALWWILAVDHGGVTPRLVAYGPSLNVVEVAGGGGIQLLQAQGHAAKAPEGTYVRADHMLRRVQATASTLSIGAPQLAFTGASSLTLLEGSAMYFGDGDAVYKVDGDAPATLLARPYTGSETTSLLAQTPAVVVLAQQRNDGSSLVSAVDKRSGAVQPLLQREAGNKEVWALRGDKVFYFAASRGAVGELRSINVDGSGDTRAFSNLLLVGRVLTRTWERGEMTDVGGTKALLACQPLPGNSDCRGTTLLQIDLTTLAVTALGAFPNSTANAWLARGGAAFEGIRGAVVEVHSTSAVGAPARKELYLFNPGEAQSLKHISPTTP